MKDKLIELIRNAPKFEFPSGSRAQGKTYQTSANLADYLIANGVVIIDPQKYPPVTGRDLISTIMGVPLDEMAALIADKENGYRKQSEGEWIVTYEYNEYRMRKEAKITCSVCGHKPKYEGYLSDMNFCNYCGAKMKGGE